MLGNKQYRLAKRMRWAARIIGLLTAGLVLAMLIGSTVAEVITGDWRTISQISYCQRAAL